MRDVFRGVPAALAAVLGLSLAGAPASAAPRLEAIATEGGLGLAAATCTAIYAPFKAFIGGSGIVVGAAAWTVTAGDAEPAMTIVERTLGGDWLVTQDHLRGKRDLAILGPERRTVARR